MASNPNVEFTFPRKYQDPTAAHNGRALEDYLRDRAYRKITAQEIEADFISVNDTIQSENYVAGSTGWINRKDGYAEFGDVDLRGNLTLEADSGVFATDDTAPRWLFDADEYGVQDFKFESGLTHEYQAGGLGVSVVASPEWAVLDLRCPALGDATNRGYGYITTYSDYTNKRSYSSITATAYGTWDTTADVGALAVGAGDATVSISASVTGAGAAVINIAAADGVVLSSGTQLRLPTGTASTPAIEFGADSGTGVYRKQDGQMAISSDGVEAAVFDYQGGNGFLFTDTIILGNEIQVQNGTVADPPIAFGTTSTGLYGVTTNYFAATASGGIIQQWGQGGSKEIYLYGLTGAGAAGRPYVRYTSADGKLFYDSSSIDLKENVRPLDFGTERFVRLRPSMFDYRDGSGDDQVGLIAEQVYEIYPELGIWGPEVNDYLEEGDDPLPEKIIDWDRSGLQAVAVEEMQKLIRRVDKLEGAS